MAYQEQDINGVLYDGDALTADGYSEIIDFSVAGGCPDAEIVLKTSDRETGESISFIVNNYNGSTYDALPTRLHGIAANGEYIIPIDNRIVTGSKMKVQHDVTLPTGSDGIKVWGHIRPRI